jgi:NADH:ubiquinone oxidoreductase subunit F (NADH-binding)
VSLRQWARRRPGEPPEDVIGEMLAGRGDQAIAAEHAMPPAAVAGVRSFYDQIDPGTTVCDGTSCRFAGGPRLAEALGEHGPVGGVRCLGHCYSAPSFRSGDRVYAAPRRMTLESWIDSWGEGPEPAESLSRIPRFSMVEQPVVLRNLIHGASAAGFGEYELPDGATILAGLEKAKLNGRGGAAYSTAAKWKIARDTPAPERWVVANGDEGDPGSYVDRLLLEEDPHAVLAGMVGCARVIGASRGMVYIRAEYPRAQEVMRQAIVAARAAGKLGGGFDVEVRGGAGSYVCGEETALLNSIEGRRGEPRVRPPYPAQAGLYGRPTVVQNVETLAAVPWVARTGRGAGTKAVSLAGALAHTGVAEVALGTPLREVLERVGGGAPPDRPWKMALIGGPMGRVLPASRFDTPLSYDALPGLGHAGVVVLDRSVSVRALAEHLFTFAREESCGNCAPCRIGTARLAAARDRAALERLLDTLEIGSFCGFGLGVPRPLRDLLEHFGDEVFA